MRAHCPVSAEQKKPFHCERGNLIVPVFAQREIDPCRSEDLLNIASELCQH